MLMGDPGVAKSLLLRRTADLAPRAIHAWGSETTQVGLTAAATPSSGNADPWEIQGGVLSRASDGLACIDNFDKLRTEAQSAIHSVLENQELNVSKASVSKTLPAKASVLGAANPKYGRFDQYQSIGEQMDIEPGLVSQFDLLFTLTDEASAQHDEALADHLLETQQAGEQRASQSNEDVAPHRSPPIDRALLQRYIRHARKHYSPRLTEDAKDELREFYVSVRSQGYDDDAPIPVTARKLEGSLRLAEVAPGCVSQRT